VAGRKEPSMDLNSSALVLKEDQDQFTTYRIQILDQFPNNIL
jgi:hypothetical protein